MKSPVPVIVVALSLLVGLSACSKERKVEIDNLSPSFASAPAETKAEVAKAAAAIKERQFEAALTSLKTVIGQPDLTDEQKTAIETATTDITVIISENPPENAEALFKLIEEIMDEVY